MALQALPCFIATATGHAKKEDLTLCARGLLHRGTQYGEDVAIMDRKRQGKRPMPTVKTLRMFLIKRDVYRSQATAFGCPDKVRGEFKEKDLTLPISLPISPIAAKRSNNFKRFLQQNQKVQRRDGPMALYRRGPNRYNPYLLKSKDKASRAKS